MFVDVANKLGSKLRLILSNFVQATGTLITYIIRELRNSYIEQTA
jgi:hypothetical protein